MRLVSNKEAGRVRFFGAEQGGLPDLRLQGDQFSWAIQDQGIKNEVEAQADGILWFFEKRK